MTESEKKGKRYHHGAQDPNPLDPKDFDQPKTAKKKFFYS